MPILERLKKWKSVRRVHTPTVLQMEAVECGAASLAMILEYHGRVVPLEELRVACGVSRDGSNASNLLKAARTYGLTAKGFKKSIASLQDMPLPVIVFWNFNHFLVLEGIGDGVYYLNDPGMGPRTVTAEEFDQSYTGITLTFEPGPEFEPGGSRPSLSEALRTRLAGSGSAVAFVVIAGLALVVPGLVIPIFSRIFVDDYLVGGMSDWIRPLLIGMGLTAILRGALGYLQQYYLLRLETKLSVSTSSQFFWHVLRLPMQFYTQRFAGDISSRVGINDQVAQLLSGRLATTAIDVLMVGFYAFLMFTYDIVLTSIGLLAAALNLYAMKLVSRRRVDGNRRLLQEQGKLMGISMGGLQTIETLKASGSESDFFARWAGHEAKFVTAQQRLAVQTQALAAVPPLLTALTTAAILAVGGYRVMLGELSMGMLVAFQSLMASFLGPVNNFVDLGSLLQETEGSMNRLDDVLRYPVDPQTAVVTESNATPEKLAGYVNLEQVTFGYSPLAPPLIENFDLNLKPGSRVALVGSSGCGKSTLARIVCGLYDAWGGEVRFDGKERRQLPRSALTSSLALVDQEICLFEGSIRDNLTLWDATIPETHIVQAAKDAAIHDEITARPGGYDSKVEEGGDNFSGGQRQRLELARALVGNPRILVLDEATSALDAVTEERIDRSLRRRGCTCIIVAHRLSTIRDCDEIIVLDQGKVIQRGTHADLSTQEEGIYARLIQA